MLDELTTQTGAVADPDAGGFADLGGDDEAREMARFYRALRTVIADRAAVLGVPRAELARRLNVSPSVVTRAMNPDRDIYASTLFALAWHLGGRWRVAIEDVVSNQEIGERRNSIVMTPTPSWNTAASNRASSIGSTKPPVMFVAGKSSA